MREFLLNTLSRLRTDEKGATLVEYGVALIVIVVVGVAGMQLLGNATAANINTAVDSMATATPYTY